MGYMNLYLETSFQMFVRLLNVRPQKEVLWIEKVMVLEAFSCMSALFYFLSTSLACAKKLRDLATSEGCYY
jgi:hypothetical protein